MSEPKDRAVEGKQPPQKKPPGYAAFEKLLKQVVKAPPLRKRAEVQSSSDVANP
jgi:hypothetical protein